MSVILWKSENIVPCNYHQPICAILWLLFALMYCTVVLYILQTWKLERVRKLGMVMTLCNNVGLYTYFNFISALLLSVPSRWVVSLLKWKVKLGVYQDLCTYWRKSAAYPWRHNEAVTRMLDSAARISILTHHPKCCCGCSPHLSVFFCQTFEICWEKMVDIFTGIRCIHIHHLNWLHGKFFIGAHSSGKHF